MLRGPSACLPSQLAAAAEIDEEPVSKAKQSRSEKKARKVSGEPVPESPAAPGALPAVPRRWRLHPWAPLRAAAPPPAPAWELGGFVQLSAPVRPRAGGCPAHGQRLVSGENSSELGVVPWISPVLGPEGPSRAPGRASGKARGHSAVAARCLLSLREPGLCRAGGRPRLFPGRAAPVTPVPPPPSSLSSRRCRNWACAR